MTVAEKRNLTEDSRVQTQALYGTEVDVLKRKHGWAKAAVHGQPSPKNDQGYPGWVPLRQLSRDPSFAVQRATEPFALVTAKTARMRKPGASKHGSGTVLSASTRLPVLARAHDGVLIATPDGGPGWISARSVHVYQSRSEIPTPNRSDLVQTAKRFLGKPYLWGVRSAFGYDCSGFTASVYQLHGITIPRDAGAQAHADIGTRVDKSNLESGDLLFYAGDSRSIYHVAMYIGKGRMIEAYDVAHPVRITHVRFGEDYWGAVRYLQRS